MYVQAGDPCLLDFSSAMIRDIGKVRKGHHQGPVPGVWSYTMQRKLAKEYIGIQKGGEGCQTKKTINFDGSWARVVPACGTLPIALLSIKLFYSRVVDKMPQIGVCGASAPSFDETGDRMRMKKPTGEKWTQWVGSIIGS